MGSCLVCCCFFRKVSSERSYYTYICLCEQCKKLNVKLEELKRAQSFINMAGDIVDRRDRKDEVVRAVYLLN